MALPGSFKTPRAASLKEKGRKRKKDDHNLKVVRTGEK